MILRAIPRCATLALGVFCVTSRATEQKPLRPGDSSGSPFTDDFASLVDEIREEWHIPGLALSVVDGDETYSEVRNPPSLSRFHEHQLTISCRDTASRHCQTLPRRRIRCGTSDRPPKPISRRLSPRSSPRATRRQASPSAGRRPSPASSTMTLSCRTPGRWRTSPSRTRPAIARG